jgi:hypothetical protein
MRLPQAAPVPFDLFAGLERLLLMPEGNEKHAHAVDLLFKQARR